MSEGDPAEFPKASDEEQLQVAKVGKLDIVQMAKVESGLPRGGLLASNFEDVTASTTSDGGSQPSSAAKPQPATPPTPPTPPPLARLCATALMIRQSLQQAEQLKEDHRQTDQLIDQVLEQATEINRELILRNQMARKKILLRELVDEIHAHPIGGHTRGI